jgi:hypothetical protein
VWLVPILKGSPLEEALAHPLASIMIRGAALKLGGRRLGGLSTTNLPSVLGQVTLPVLSRLQFLHREMEVTVPILLTSLEYLRIR